MHDKLLMGCWVLARFCINFWWVDRFWPVHIREGTTSNIERYMKVLKGIKRLLLQSVINYMLFVWFRSVQWPKMECSKWSASEKRKSKWHIPCSAGFDIIVENKMHRLLTYVIDCWLKQYDLSPIDSICKLFHKN